MEKSTIIDAARYHIQMTPEEFLDWVDEDDSAELIDGEVNVASPASGRHQEIELFLGTILGLFVRRHQLGRVYLSQFMMRLGNNLFVPDVMYLSNKKLTQRLPNYMKGPADMVMEIVSPESIVRDRQRKFSAYQAAGVREYWLFEPETEEVSVFRLGLARKYRKIVPDKDGTVRSAVVPKFFVRPAWVWTDPPDEFAALRELDIRIE